MHTQYLDSYLEAWQVHCATPAESARTMSEAAGPQVAYSDINLPAAFAGHTGIADMCRLASGILPGAKLEIQQRISSGSTWVIQWQLVGTAGQNKQPFRIDGTSWGTLGKDGKVVSQRDYWNPAHYKDQVGRDLFAGA
jgi:hypothetical protein